MTTQYVFPAGRLCDENERMCGDSYHRFDIDSDRNDLGISLDLFRDIGSRQNGDR